MKHLTKNVLLITIALLFSVSYLAAQDAKSEQCSKKDKDTCCMSNDSTNHHMMNMESDSMHTMNKEAKIWNLYCPVRGEEVDPEVPTAVYKDKVIGFCCPGCDAKFKADPEKYMKNLSEDGTKFIGEK